MSEGKEGCPPATSATLNLGSAATTTRAKWASLAFDAGVPAALVAAAATLPPVTPAHQSPCMDLQMLRILNLLSSLACWDADAVAAAGAASAAVGALRADPPGIIHASFTLLNGLLRQPGAAAAAVLQQLTAVPLLRQLIESIEHALRAHSASVLVQSSACNVLCLLLTKNPAAITAVALSAVRESAIPKLLLEVLVRLEEQNRRRQPLAAEQREGRRGAKEDVKETQQQEASLAPLLPGMVCSAIGSLLMSAKAESRAGAEEDGSGAPGPRVSLAGRWSLRSRRCRRASRPSQPQQPR